ncbi:MAG: hypothetical protein COT45_03200 [bacterium (Candidatus Stahlbacteria) CG08_land_8_20_14_0_20_40_26]|nr:MAG: hypothetical protein COX49_09390 [bacterium (Candidatus Stahlbacteria) CG23_combo_of_CG06-09_8_20_14_all_40_9]PIS24996.1 MAG: hypothetical protein COT45_03200 [bacterium (Candidatus Stahlbacteria) CG08_land_8_20_14_0_20_40_26]
MDKTQKIYTVEITTEQIDMIVYPPTLYLAKIYHYLTKSKVTEEDINREVWYLIRRVREKLEAAKKPAYTGL